MYLGVTTSRATSGDRKNDPNTSGQRWNNFHTSYIDRSFVVSGNNRVVKPKCKQFTSLNKMLSNSKVLIVHISFTALINNEGIGGIRKVPRRIKCTFCSCRKQSCCKAEMLPSYTSLLKKLSNFPQALTGTILLMLYWPTEVSGKALLTPGKASRRMIFTLCNLLCDEKNVSWLVQSINHSWLPFHLNFVSTA